MLLEIERFIKAHNMAPSRFGRNAVNDPKLVSNLRAGREMRPATADRVREYIRCGG